MDWDISPAKIKIIYQNLDSYKALSEGDQRFFDNLFILLLVSDVKELSNKYLSYRFNIPVSTVEKRINHLKKAKLITRSVEYNNYRGKWRAVKSRLDLDPVTFSFARIEEASERLKTVQLEYILAVTKEIEEAHPELKQLKERSKPVEPEPQYRVEVTWD